MGISNNRDQPVEFLARRDNSYVIKQLNEIALPGPPSFSNTCKMNLQVFGFSRREDARSLREITCLLLNNSAGRFVYYFSELEELKIARLFLKCSDYLEVMLPLSRIL